MASSGWNGYGAATLCLHVSRCGRHGSCSAIGSSGRRASCSHAMSREVAVGSPGGHVTEPSRERLRCPVGRTREVGRRPRSRGGEPLVRRYAHLSNLWCAATPISAGVDASPLPVGRHDSPAGAHSARASLALPTPSLPLQPRVVSLGRQLLRHRLRQQPRHPLPLVVAHRADDHLQPLRRHAAFLTSGCGRGMRLWGQKYQTGVNAAFMTKK